MVPLLDLGWVNGRSMACTSSEFRWSFPISLVTSLLIFTLESSLAYCLYFLHYHGWYSILCQLFLIVFHQESVLLEIQFSWYHWLMKHYNNLLLLFPQQTWPLHILLSWLMSLSDQRPSQTGFLLQYDYSVTLLISYSGQYANLLSGEILGCGFSKRVRRQLYHYQR